MNTRTSSALTFLLAIAAAATVGWGMSLASHQDETGFRAQRIALLESEVARLRTALRQREHAEAAPALARQRQEIEQAVESIRGLAFTEPVAYDMVTRAGIQQVLHDKLSEQVSAEEFRRVGLALTAFGFVEPGYDLRQKYLDLLSEQLAAFYDQHEHKLFMFEDADLNSMQNRVILAHELTHALQDQHFSLLKLPLELKTNDDRAFAASALVEGEATLVMTEYLLKNLSLRSVSQSVTGMFLQNMDELQNAPLYLQTMLLFPYLRGQEFALALQARGGYAALTAAYADPPASTAQILHPELFYGSERVDPIEVNWPAPQVNGQAPAYSNVLGEMGIRLLLDEAAEGPSAETAAAGWAGDRYLLFETAGDWQLFWRTLWRTPEDAEEFAAALDRWRAGRLARTPDRLLEIRRPSPLTVDLINATSSTQAQALKTALAQPQP